MNILTDKVFMVRTCGDSENGTLTERPVETTGLEVLGLLAFYDTYNIIAPNIWIEFELKDYPHRTPTVAELKDLALDMLIRIKGC